VVDASLLFTAHRNGVFRYLTRLVGEAEAARDLTQEVFLRVARGPVPEATEVERRAWVFRIARNLALNHLRDGRRRPQAVELTEAAAPATQELAVAVQQALAALPPLERDVFLLRETAGLGYDEIAGACDLTVDAVRMRLHRARSQLRATLDAPVAAERARGVRLTHHRGSDD
jgi:RNA polymerase sigma-70 factor (ECF subfamily)